VLDKIFDTEVDEFALLKTSIHQHAFVSVNLDNERWKVKINIVFFLKTFCSSGSVTSNVLSVHLFSKELTLASRMLSKYIPTGKIVFKVCFCTFLTLVL
jgi:hypothetical protein